MSTERFSRLSKATVPDGVGGSFETNVVEIFERRPVLIASGQFFDEAKARRWAEGFKAPIPEGRS